MDARAEDASADAPDFAAAALGLDNLPPLTANWAAPSAPQFRNFR
jgi:hypothetical protein